jgi:hypothetical protein
MEHPPVVVSRINEIHEKRDKRSLGLKNGRVPGYEAPYKIKAVIEIPNNFTLTDSSESISIRFSPRK